MATKGANDQRSSSSQPMPIIKIISQPSRDGHCLLKSTLTFVKNSKSTKNSKAFRGGTEPAEGTIGELDRFAVSIAIICPDLFGPIPLHFSKGTLVGFSLSIASRLG